ncbi:hypothetical protein [Anaerotignum sp.]|uniref:hypothetical protein n=1 Tax=Anaerotignum sp. TaxID=2039241 RepID=UPI0027147C7F|nr:hypothetical protein [Anaerotignum sp.]
MKFYIIPLFISICILLLVLMRHKALQKHEKVSISVVLTIGCIGLIYAVFTLFQKEIMPISVFLFVAPIFQYSVHCFANLQEKENLFTPKVAYAILMAFWISLVVSFLMEATVIQGFLENTK